MIPIAIRSVYWSSRPRIFIITTGQLKQNVVAINMKIKTPRCFFPLTWGTLLSPPPFFYHHPLYKNDADLILNSIIPDTSHQAPFFETRKFCHLPSSVPPGTTTTAWCPRQRANVQRVPTAKNDDVSYSLNSLKGVI